MFHEVPDSAFAAAKMEQHTWPHDSPAHSGAPANSGVRVGNIDNTEMNEIDDLPIHRGLQPIGDVSDHLFADVNRFLSDGAVKFDCALDRFLRRLRPAHYFNQGNHVWRIKRMPNDAA